MVEQVEPTVASEIAVEAADLAFVTDTLQAVVTLPYGTGTAAFAGFGIPVAGKSGTAETGTPDPHAWFPAYAPADDPTISVATILPYIPLGTGRLRCRPARAPRDGRPLLELIGGTIPPPGEPLGAEPWRRRGRSPCALPRPNGSIGLAAPDSPMVNAARRATTTP